MKRTATAIVWCLVYCTVAAQPDSLVKKPVVTARSYFSAGISYLSNAIYNGRKDSVATPYLTPMLGYYNKSGFFIDGSLSYLARSGSSRIDLFNIEAGYDYNLGNFDGEIVAAKPFYSSQSTNVKSQITGSLSASGGYDFTYIKPTVSAGLNFGTKTDYVLSFGLEHTFYFLHDKLQLTPTFLANGSTQNYYGAYYNKRKVGGKKKNGGIVYDVTATVENASQFKILDDECSLPLIYIVHKFSFIVTPAYAWPVNPALVAITRKPETGPGATITRTAKENTSNTFYCSVGMTYKF